MRAKRFLGYLSLVHWPRRARVGAFLFGGQRRDLHPHFEVSHRKGGTRGVPSPSSASIPCCPYRSFVCSLR